jgi:hypothetical protein
MATSSVNTWPAGRVSLSMGSLETLHLSLAVCAGMVAATLVPSARRSIPRWFEGCLWIALIVLCWLGLATIQDPKARELSSSIAWASAQIAYTALGLIGAGFTGWLSDHRFVIATWVVIVCGVDVFLLALISSWRQGQGWQPRVCLGDWRELPRLAIPKPVVVVEDPFAEVNRKLAAVMVVARAAAWSWIVNFGIWLRQVFLPREAKRLRRGTVLVATGAAAAARDMVSAARRRGLRRAHVLDIRPLLSARSIGWHGPFPLSQVQLEEPVEDGAGRSDRLAS